ncbi:MAG: glycosyltransferase family 2 protein [bacterium]
MLESKVNARFPHSVAQLLWYYCPALRLIIELKTDNMTASRLSVVMPAHNALPFLNDSIRCILDQTFSDFEFIILDDASTDGSDRVLREWEKRDSRIRLLKSDRKLGLSASSNFTVRNSTAPIVARMDADDTCAPDRLERQWEILRRQPEVVALGTLCEGIDAGGRHVRPRDRWRLVRRSPYVPFPHGSAMFRRSAFDAINGYSEQYAGGEDQNFFFRMRSVGRVVTLPDMLYQYRYHAANATLVTANGGLNGNSNRYTDKAGDIAAFYMLGAMRLWAGQPLRILPQMVAKRPFKPDLQTMMALASASLGTVSPCMLRFFLRSLIRSRDFLAGLSVKDGRAYEWHLK